MNSKASSCRRLESIHCKPYQTRWWGIRRLVTPQLVRQPFGDGRVLLALQPMDTRPNYYLLRIDSAWTQGNADEIYEHLDEFYEAIEDEFGPCQCAECRYGRRDENRDEEELPWPAPRLCLGASWWWVTNPAQEARRRRTQ